MPVQLFGTDISEKAIEKARAGFYPDGAVRDVSAERLARFFTKVEGGGYRINKSVRERCAFVKHDLASRSALLEARPGVLPQRSHLLRPGAAEAGARHVPLRAERARLSPARSRGEHRRRDESLSADRQGEQDLRQDRGQEHPPAGSSSRCHSGHAADRASRERRLRLDVVRRTESLLLDQYAPPGVIVNGRMEILHFRGRTGPYLEPAPGQPQHDLLKMARKGLVADLRIAISQAQEGRRPPCADQACASNRTAPRASVTWSWSQSRRRRSRERTCSPFSSKSRPRRSRRRRTAEGPRSERRLGGRAVRTSSASPSSKTSSRRPRSTSSRSSRSTSGPTRSSLSANEELVSSNEELQSLNEELQTAKEELQSTNEELSTLNEEMQTRNAELNSANSDLVNILGQRRSPDRHRRWQIAASAASRRRRGPS